MSFGEKVTHLVVGDYADPDKLMHYAIRRFRDASYVDNEGYTLEIHEVGKPPASAFTVEIEIDKMDNRTWSGGAIVIRARAINKDNRPMQLYIYNDRVEVTYPA